MKTIWLINPYGPIEGEKWREYSFNQFGKYLSQQGFNVIWWTASFSHHFKKQRSYGWKDIEVNNNFIIRLVPTTTYTKNFGLGRLWKDIIFSIRSLKRFKNESFPDIIIANENPICMGKPAFYYANKNNIPIIYDQMDIWPEFFVGVLKFPLNKIAHVLLKPIYSKRKKIYEELNGSIALGKHYLEFMQKISPNLKYKPHVLIYNGIDVKKFRSQLHNNICHSKLQINKSDNEIWCIFAGTLGPSYDITTIINAAKKCDEQDLKIFKFIIAGSGPLEDIVIEAEENLDNLVYVGKLLPEELIPIYGKCDVGLSTYSKGSNVDMCDKFYDYTAAGLAIINSLKGEIFEHIEKKELGYNYSAGNIKEFMDALLNFTDYNTLKKIKENSINVANIFDKNVQNQKLLSVIEEILNMEKEVV